MAFVASPEVGVRADLRRLLRLSLATWLVAIVPAIANEIPVLQMSFGISQSLAIIGEAGILLATALAILVFAIYATTVPILGILRLGYRIRPTMVPLALLGLISVATTTRTIQVWIGAVRGLDRPLRPSLEIMIWLAGMFALYLFARLDSFRVARHRIIDGMSQAATVTLLLMLLSWALWIPHYLRPVPPPPTSVEIIGNGQPNIVLITLDTLAAGNTSLLGYERETTPSLRRFSNEATVFEDTISSANFTTPGIAAIMTGRYATRNGTYHLSSRLPDSELQQSVPAQLSGAGYQLAAFVGNSWAHPANLALDAYFDELPLTEMRPPFGWPYAVPTKDSKLNGMGLWNFLLFPWTTRIGYLPWWNGSSPFRVEEIFDSARRFLAARSDHRPLFLWVHVFPPHGPYLPPPPYRHKYLASNEMLTFSAQEAIPYGRFGYDEIPSVRRMRDRYDENISYVDAELGKFLNFLEDSGALSNSYVIITSDHGESFEKGWRGHVVPALHQSLIHVPLVIYSPKAPQGEVRETPTETVDVAATVLDIAGIRNIPEMDGRSLRRFVDDNQPFDEKTRYAMWLTDTPDYECPDSGLFAAFDGRRKLVWDISSNSTALFDLAVDAHERYNVAPANVAYVEALKAQVTRDLLDCDRYVHP